MRKGILFVLSGPSGAGKGTILKEVLASVDNVRFSVSATTRAPRDGEVDGKSYFFMSRERFYELKGKGEFLESVEKFGNCYGTLRSHVENILEEGTDVLLEIETIGAANVKRLMPESVLMFVTPSDTDVIRERLIGRGTEHAANQMARLEAGLDELKCIKDYDYVIINDDLNSAINDARAVILAERCRRDRNIEFIEKFIQ